jgi:hypothetical protein
VDASSSRAVNLPRGVRGIVVTVQSPDKVRTKVKVGVRQGACCRGSRVRAPKTSSCPATARKKQQATVKSRYTPEFAHLPGAACADPPRDSPMDEEDSLSGLEGLHRDLCAFIDLKLPVVDRLVSNLEARLGELKALLDKKPKSNASRSALSTGKYTADIRARPANLGSLK